jgi:hypothetical protein
MARFSIGPYFPLLSAESHCDDGTVPQPKGARKQSFPKAGELLH